MDALGTWVLRRPKAKIRLDPALVVNYDHEFTGQEYLGLYPTVDKLAGLAGKIGLGSRSGLALHIKSSIYGKLPTETVFIIGALSNSTRTEDRTNISSTPELMLVRQE